MKLDFLLGTNADSDIVSVTVRAVESARDELAQEDIRFQWRIISGWSYCKGSSILVSEFLKETDLPYFVFLDRDILFFPWQLKRLYESLKAGYDLIGGLYCLRNGKCLSGRLIEGTKLSLDNRIYELEVIATGFTGVSRKLLEQIRDKYELPEYTYNKGTYWSFFEDAYYEKYGATYGADYALCEKARGVGAKIYLDTGIQLGHVGNYTYTMKDFLQFFEKESV